jgi:hypothetical protein
MSAQTKKNLEPFPFVNHKGSLCACAAFSLRSREKTRCGVPNSTGQAANKVSSKVAWDARYPKKTRPIKNDRICSFPVARVHAHPSPHHVASDHGPAWRVHAAGSRGVC